MTERPRPRPHHEAPLPLIEMSPQRENIATNLASTSAPTTTRQRRPTTSTTRLFRYVALGMRFTTAVTHEDGWYVARCLEVEVTSQGTTVEESLANLKEALELYFEDVALPADIEPPIIATVELSA